MGESEPGRARGRGRTSARRISLEVLVEADLRGASVAELLAARGEEEDLPPYAVVLVEGISASGPEVDEAITEHLRSDWPLDRLGAVERAIMRIGSWELLAGDVPGEVAVDEAVELAKRYASLRAARLVNGVLGAMLRRRQGAGHG